MRRRRRKPILRRARYINPDAEFALNSATLDPNVKQTLQTLLDIAKYTELDNAVTWDFLNSPDEMQITVEHLQFLIDAIKEADSLMEM